MTSKEKGHPTTETVFDDSRAYENYLRDHGLNTTSRAIGRLKPDGGIEVVIDKPYYLRGGIQEDQLPAITRHETTELTSSGPDPHYDGTVDEYRLVLEQGGEKALRQYHSRLCNLIGGRNDVRNAALKAVLKK